jgi:hypothetical protein
MPDAGSGKSAENDHMSEQKQSWMGSGGWSTTQLVWSSVGAFVLGAGLLYGAGFHWVGNWQTGSAVEKRLAVAECVQNFLLEADRGVVYTRLQETTSAFQRRQLIQNNRWAPDREVADLCDTRIRALDPAHFAPQVDDTEAAAETEAPA